jgi:23S rRNA-/tRNA-specific pseudouridylate synthase
LPTHLVGHIISQAALLNLYPTTGKTHQLRVHCSELLASSILGDGKYGRNVDNIFFKVDTSSLDNRKIPTSTSRRTITHHRIVAAIEIRVYPSTFTFERIDDS